MDNPFRYRGEYQDEETGNYYLRARYYDPSVQRFINEDSFAVERGAGWLEHLYGYARNNPINFSDPTGHLPKFLQKAIDENNRKIKELGTNFNKTKDPKKRAEYHIRADERRIQNKQILYWTSSDDKEKAKLQAEINSIRHEHGWTWADTQYFTPDGPGISFGNHPVTKKEIARFTKKKVQVKKVTAVTTSKVTPDPAQPKNIKTIQDTVDEFDGKKARQDIWKGMTGQGWKPYKQTAGAVMIGGGVVVTGGLAGSTVTTADSLAVLGYTAVDVFISPPPPSTPGGALIYKGSEWVFINPNIK